MKIYIFIFSLFFLLNTEGAAQEAVDTLSTTIEAPSENANDDEMDDAAYEAALAKSEKAYQDNLQKYYDENIPQKDFDKDTWQKATNGLDYTIDAEKEKEEKNRTRAKNADTPPTNISPALIAFLKWFFILGAVVLLGYLIYRFVDGGNVFGNNSRRVHLPSVGIDLEELEENLEESDDIEPFIRKAIEKKEYAIAVRLYYLAILKELSLRNAIEWKKDKTNRTYVREMRKHALHEPFNNMTNTFERVWYGDTRLDKATFLGVQPAFRDLLNQSKKA
jgi:hypothetical protein